MEVRRNCTVAVLLTPMLSCSVGRSKDVSCFFLTSYAIIVLNLRLAESKATLRNVRIELV